MSFTPIQNGEITVDQPVTDQLMQKIKNNFDDLNTRVSSPTDVPNADFQIDGDADGIPDNFTRSLYTAGSAAFDTTTPYAGVQSYKFTRVAGAGNGGGYLDTTYLEISEYISPLVQVAFKASVAGIRVMVQARYYDRTQTFLSSEDLYNSISNPTVWTTLSLIPIPPANAKFMKLRLIGGYTDPDVAGTVTFGAVHYNAFPTVIPVPFTLSGGGTYSSAWTDVASAAVKIPKGFTRLSFSMMMSVSSYSNPNTGSFRVRIGTNYSPAITLSAPSGTSVGGEQATDMDITAVSGAGTLVSQSASSNNNQYDGSAGINKPGYFALATR